MSPFNVLHTVTPLPNSYMSSPLSSQQSTTPKVVEDPKAAPISEELLKVAQLKVPTVLPTQSSSVPYAYPTVPMEFINSSRNVDTEATASKK